MKNIIQICAELIMRYLRLLVAGMLIGIANIIPGVSGGTMAVVTGVYDRFVDALANFKKHPKDSLAVLIPIVAGVLGGIFAFSGVIAYCLHNHSAVSYMFLVGVIIGSIPEIVRRALQTKFKPVNLIYFFLTLGIMVLLFILGKDKPQSVAQTAITAWLIVKMFFAGIIASSTMVIPGISGSLVMVLLGMYETIIAAVQSFNFPILISFLAGAVIGIAGIIKLLSVLFQKAPQATYAAILGFLAGAVIDIYPGLAFDLNGLYAVLGGIAGIAVSILFSKNSDKKQ